ncbi:hypothetical protein SBRY_70221 [Actinacidiphila bryophytorum]|uniref:Uncharacterized protein n=1 Tax=Actinacidiphila bryophytorum TaxID=1436133 RepID=A0A9W4H7C5_9ACTN|nr:hypothetical protein SBRY_70221 [Actinacidiphila bryophytorum]
MPERPETAVPISFTFLTCQQQRRNHRSNQRALSHAPRRRRDRQPPTSVQTHTAFPRLRLRRGRARGVRAGGHPEPGQGRGQPALAGQDRDRLLHRERRHPSLLRGGRQHRHPLVQRGRRPAVAAGRPRRDLRRHPGHAELGDRLRQGLPDPGLGERHQLDERVLHHHRDRWQRDTFRKRFRALCPDLHDPAGHPMGSLALGVPGLRQHRHRQRRLQHHERGTEQDRDRLLHRERRHPGLLRGGRQQRHPLVERRGRPAVAAGRPGLVAEHLRCAAQLGNRLRQGLPDPGLGQRHQLDQRVLHHHRSRRHRADHADRHRALRADVRHPARHPVRLLAVGVPGLHRRQRQHHRDHDRRDDRRDHHSPHRRRDPAVVQQTGHLLDLPERQQLRRLHPVQGLRRGPGDPLGDQRRQRLGGPGLDRGRPRRDRPHHQGRPAVGPGLRDGVPDPDVRGRHQLDQHLLHHHGQGLQGDPDRGRQRALRADVRHRAQQRLRLLAVDLRRVRHRRQPHRAAGHPAEPGQPRTPGVERRVQRGRGHQAGHRQVDPGHRRRPERRAGVLHQRRQHHDGRQRQPGDRGQEGERRGPPVHLGPDQHLRPLQLHLRPRRGADQGVRHPGPVARVLDAGLQLQDRHAVAQLR